MKFIGSIKPLIVSMLIVVLLTPIFARATSDDAIPITTLPSGAEKAIGSLGKCISDNAVTSREQVLGFCSVDAPLDAAAIQALPSCFKIRKDWRLGVWQVDTPELDAEYSISMQCARSELHMTIRKKGNKFWIEGVYELMA